MKKILSLSTACLLLASAGFASDNLFRFEKDPYAKGNLISKDDKIAGQETDQEHTQRLILARVLNDIWYQAASHRTDVDKGADKQFYDKEQNKIEKHLLAYPFLKPITPGKKPADEDVLDTWRDRQKANQATNDIKDLLQKIVSGSPIELNSIEPKDDLEDILQSAKEQIVANRAEFKKKPCAGSKLDLDTVRGHELKWALQNLSENERQSKIKAIISTIKAKEDLGLWKFYVWVGLQDSESAMQFFGTPEGLSVLFSANEVAFKDIFDTYSKKLSLDQQNAGKQAFLKWSQDNKDTWKNLKEAFDAQKFDEVEQILNENQAYFNALRFFNLIERKNDKTLDTGKTVEKEKILNMLTPLSAIAEGALQDADNVKEQQIRAQLAVHLLLTKPEMIYTKPGTLERVELVSLDAYVKSLSSPITHDKGEPKNGVFEHARFNSFEMTLSWFAAVQEKGVGADATKMVDGKVQKVGAKIGALEENGDLASLQKLKDLYFQFILDLLTISKQGLSSNGLDLKPISSAEGAGSTDTKAVYHTLEATPRRFGENFNNFAQSSDTPSLAWVAFINQTAEVFERGSAEQQKLWVHTHLTEMLLAQRFFGKMAADSQRVNETASKKKKGPSIQKARDLLEELKGGIAALQEKELQEKKALDKAKAAARAELESLQERLETRPLERAKKLEEIKNKKDEVIESLNVLTAEKNAKKRAYDQITAKVNAHNDKISEDQKKVDTALQEKCLKEFKEVQENYNQASEKGRVFDKAKRKLQNEEQILVQEVKRQQAILDQEEFADDDDDLVELKKQMHDQEEILSWESTASTFDELRRIYSESQTMLSNLTGDSLQTSNGVYGVHYQLQKNFSTSEEREQAVYKKLAALPLYQPGNTAEQVVADLLVTAAFNQPDAFLALLVDKGYDLARSNVSQWTGLFEALMEEEDLQKPPVKVDEHTELGPLHTEAQKSYRALFAAFSKHQPAPDKQVMNTSKSWVRLLERAKIGAYKLK